MNPSFGTLSYWAARVPLTHLHHKVFNTDIRGRDTQRLVMQHIRQNWDFSAVSLQTFVYARPSEGPTAAFQSLRSGLRPEHSSTFILLIFSRSVVDWGRCLVAWPNFGRVLAVRQLSILCYRKEFTVHCKVTKSCGCKQAQIISPPPPCWQHEVFLLMCCGWFSKGNCSKNCFVVCSDAFSCISYKQAVIVVRLYCNMLAEAHRVRDEDALVVFLEVLWTLHDWLTLGWICWDVLS